jgi:2-iminoacetate synthase ThiH
MAAGAESVGSSTQEVLLGLKEAGLGSIVVVE